MTKQDLTPRGGDKIISDFSKTVAKGRAPHYGTLPSDLTSVTFDRGDAGAEKTERRKTAEMAEGGRNADVAEGQAAEVKTKGTVGPANVRGSGKMFAEGGSAPARGKASVAAPASPAITGNPKEPVARRSGTRDYDKDGEK